MYITRFLRNDLVVSVRSKFIDERIDQTEEKDADSGTCKQERDVVMAEQQEELMYDRQYYRQVHAGKEDRNEEYREHL